MKTPGYFVSPLIELATGMEHGESYLHGGFTYLGVHFNGNPPPIVFNSYGIVLIYSHGNILAKPR